MTAPGSTTAVPGKLRRLLVEGGFFDEDFYRLNNPDVGEGDLLAHYLTFGHAEGRRPSPAFDPRAYLAANPDVAAVGSEPLVHYAQNGRAENRLLRPEERDALVPGLFDPGYYRDAHGIFDQDPLLHYLGTGFRLGWRPNPAFDPLAYLAAFPDIAAAGQEPLTHHLRAGGAPGVIAAATPARFPAARLAVRQAVEGRAFLRQHGLTVTPDSESPPARLRAAVTALADLPAPFGSRGEPLDASIIIPPGAEPAAVLNCLHALASQRSRFRAEIIVCDASPLLHPVPWVRVVDGAAGGDSFAQACAASIAIAAGHRLIVLDARCRPAEGWLDELLGHFEQRPLAGLVGARLVGEDIRLDQSGQIVRSDGGVLDYGRGGDPDDPKYSFARRVDACGTAFAVSRAALAAAGGFGGDAPLLGRETTDLALRVAASGHEVWVQPLAICLRYRARVVSPAAPDVVLATRWAATLGRHGGADADPARQADRRSGERLLVIDAAVPTPDRDAGSLVLTEMLGLLRAMNYQIAFMALPEPDFADGYTERLQRAGVECLHAPFVTDLESALEFHGAFDVVFAFRYTVLEPVLATLRGRLPQARIVFNNVDMHYVRAMREAEIQGSASGRIAAYAAKEAELAVIASVDCTIVHTAVEAGLIRDETGLDNVVEIPWVTAVEPATAAFASRGDVLFLGNYLHSPNVDAARYLVEELWPLMLPHLPAGARLVLAGASPPPSVASLAGKRVVVTGYLADVSPLFEAARVFVAPLRYGAGIKGKVIESLRRGLPCVATSIAAEGIGLANGVEGMICDDPADLAGAVLRLFGDEAAWRAMQEAGYRFIEQNYSAGRGLALIRRALEVADETWIERSGRRLRSELQRLRPC